MASYLADNKLISIVAGRMIPEHIRNTNPGFQKFVEGYLRFIEQPGEPYDIITNLFEYTDIDKTSGEYLEMYKDQYARYIPDYITNDFSFFIKNIKFVLRSKGTQPSFDFFFRYVFEGSIEIDYPREQMFKLSAAKWIVPTFIDVIEDIQNNGTYNESVAYYINSKIEGSISGATAFIQETKLVTINAIQYQLLSIHEPSIVGSFQSGETIKVIETSNVLPEPLFEFMISSSKITESLVIEADIKILGDNYGYSVEAFDTGRIITSSPSKQGLLGVNEGKCYVIDPSGENPVIEVSPSDGAINDNFGQMIFSHKDKCLISSDNSTNGAAYLFNSNGSQLQKFVASSGGTLEVTANSAFGSSLGLYDDKVVIGSKTASVLGKVYFYSSDGSNDTVIQPISSTDVEGFGKSVAINGNRFFVGADFNNISTKKESVYLFDYDSSNLAITLAAQDISFNSANKSIASVSDIDFSGLLPNDIITVSGTSLNDGTYSIVNVFSNYINVTETLSDEGAGAVVQIFKDVSNIASVNEFKIIEGSDTIQGDGFGNFIAADEQNIVIGCPNQNSGKGAVYIFDILGNNEIKIDAPSNLSNNAHFGANISLEDEGILISAPDDILGGTVFLYGTKGNQISILSSSDVMAGDTFGSGSCISGTDIFIGAPNTDSVAVNSGKIYKFDLERANSAIIQQAGFYDGVANTLSGGSVFQDSDYYQDFSYVIQSPVSSDLYKPWLDKYAHPAAYKNFTEVLKIPGKPSDASIPFQSQYVYTELTLFDGLKTVALPIQDITQQAFFQSPLRDETNSFWNHNTVFVDSKRTFNYYEYFRETLTSGFMTIENLDEEIIGSFDIRSGDLMNYSVSVPYTNGYRKDIIDPTNYYEGISLNLNDQETDFKWKVSKVNHDGSGVVISSVTAQGDLSYDNQWSDRLSLTYK